MATPSWVSGALGRGDAALTDIELYLHRARLIEEAD